jgi:TRAP-type C4-dicarboxylate transport system permease small subunit
MNFRVEGRGARPRSVATGDDAVRAGGIDRAAIRASRRLNWLVERVCVALLILLVVDVWLGVLVRYVLPLGWTFTEELARYLMIWAALLAVSSGISHREHIGMVAVVDLFPAAVRKWLAVAFDLVAFGFFAILFFYGLGFVDRGFNRVTMIADIPKAWPFMAVPIAAGLACVQLLLVAVHDFFSSDGVTAAERVEV